MDIFPACKVIKKDGKLGIDVATKYPVEFASALEKYAKKEFVKVILKRSGESKSENQRRAFHSLLALYYKSGLHSAANKHELKIALKIDYGWIANYTYNGKTYEVIVSTEKYTKEWYSRIIDGTISEMEQVGILSSQYAGEYREIIEGMNGNN